MAGVSYLHGHQPAVVAAHARRTAADSAAYLVGELRPGLSLLDVGSGPGTITADLAELVAPGPVTALETSPDTLALTRDTLTARGVDAAFEVGDVQSLGFDDDSFDVVHAHQVLQHLDDPVQALREMGRVSRRLVAARDADYAAFTWYPEHPALTRWLELYHDLARASGHEPDAGRRLVAWAHAAGLPDVRASASVWCYAGADAHWWGTSWADRVLTSTFAGRALAAGVDRHELDDIAAGWRAWADDPDAWFLVPHGEVLAPAPR